jgi:hypothetical protein
MMKWIAVAVAAAALTSGAQPTPTSCADPARRTAAIQFARAINTAEAASFRGQRSYLQLGDLPIGTAPTGMTAQLSTDGESYAFSIKDTLNGCTDALFSDQVGVIYIGRPIQ